MTKLGEALAATPAAPSSPATKATRLMAALASARVLRPIKLPGLELTALMTLVGAERLLEIEADVAKEMTARGMADEMLHARKWELARATRVLAEALLDDDPKLRDNPPPIGTHEDIGRMTREQVVELWTMYDELAEECDPGRGNVFTQEERELIAIAVKKKEPTLLRSFGAKRLSAYLLSTDAPHASSSTAESSPGDSSQES